MKPEPAIIVIFGITGDLSQRYLLPSLYHLVKDGLMHPYTEIVGVTRGDTTTTQLFEKVELCVNEIDNICDPAALDSMHARTTMFQMDLGDPASYKSLLEKLNDIEKVAGLCLNRLYYLSIPPTSYQPVIRLLGENGLNGSCPDGEAKTRLLVEKPFGYDLPSAEELIRETGKHFAEEQVFRIDHYMAKDTVQDILTERFNNPHIEEKWNNQHISRIEITAKEKIGIEGRSVFYEPLGALRDFIQSHLIQILGIITMDKPATLDSQNIHINKQAALGEITEADPRKARRGQYRGYRDEVGNPASKTETFAAIELDIDNARWQGVPFKLVTGKALDERKTEVKIIFKDAQTEEVVFPINPTEPGRPTAYERVLIDALRGDHTVFATSEEIVDSWRVLQPVVEAWSENGDDLVIYEPGSAGPAPNTI